MESTVISVPMIDHDLKCPACMCQISVTVETRVAAQSARINGRTSFRGYVASDLKVAPTRMIINHTCDIPEKDD